MSQNHIFGYDGKQKSMKTWYRAPNENPILPIKHMAAVVQCNGLGYEMETRSQKNVFLVWLTALTSEMVSVCLMTKTASPKKDELAECVDFIPTLQMFPYDGEIYKKTETT
ncbi:hypothetical protein NPIL_65321 [Nephila pilipes]|uniref:Uncharacterized protein n=1 Tax=Nephila pilipes TaxID=299642 RepID=A0A8X6P306_NEPPI|nr:hypothetical protein NPIL_65321 [Nephila pilipes]